MAEASVGYLFTWLNVNSLAKQMRLIKLLLYLLKASNQVYFTNRLTTFALTIYIDLHYSYLQGN